MRISPQVQSAVIEAVRWALSEHRSLEIVGHGSKRGLGNPLDADHVLELSHLSGIALYEPEELVMSTAAGTPLETVETELAANDQQLAFEAGDWGPLFGAPPGQATIGGVFACNLSGPRRIRAGAARDHLLGVAAVSGRAEPFRAGGRVVKNVTGYDLCKLMAGSHGSLAVMTELTFKVLPAPEASRTLLLAGLSDVQAATTMSRALSGPYEVSAAAHLPAVIASETLAAAGGAAHTPLTALRIEGTTRSVVQRAAALRDALVATEPALELTELADSQSQSLWRELRDVRPFVRRPDCALWRLSLPPAPAADVVARIQRELDVVPYYDWGGALAWLGVPLAANPTLADAGAAIIRAAAGTADGRAQLIRAPDDIRRAVGVFHPEPPALALLTERLRESFDPHGILNPGRVSAKWSTK